MGKYFGGIEAGGTKFVCAIGTENLEIIEELRFPTGEPHETIEKAIAFFTKFSDTYPLSVLAPSGLLTSMFIQKPMVISLLLPSQVGRI